MCDVKKYNEISEDILKLTIADIRQLIIEAESDEKRKLYVCLHNHFLQEHQMETIKEHVF